jgi:hypothetical protein
MVPKEFFTSGAEKAADYSDQRQHDNGRGHTIVCTGVLILCGLDNIATGGLPSDQSGNGVAYGLHLRGQVSRSKEKEIDNY